MNGANKNCMVAYKNVIQPPYKEALLKSLVCSKPFINCGTTGMMMPSPTISMTSVKKMNPTAAFFVFAIKKIDG
jgi:hypothetical protein